MKNFFYNVIKKFKGNVLTIGVDDDYILKYMNNNSNINVFTIDKDKGNRIIKRKKRKMNSSKNINIKKLKKYFYKKSIDYIICDITEIKDYIKYFVPNSIYLNCNKLYIYGNNDIIDVETIIKKYKRYKTTIDVKLYKDDYIITIDNTKSKNKRLREKFYFIKDTFINLADFISTILVS